MQVLYQYNFKFILKSYATMLILWKYLILILQYLYLFQYILIIIYYNLMPFFPFPFLILKFIR